MVWKIQTKPSKTQGNPQSRLRSAKAGNPNSHRQNGTAGDSTGTATDDGKEQSSKRILIKVQVLRIYARQEQNRSNDKSTQTILEESQSKIKRADS